MATVKDPVCGMDADPATARQTAQHQGQTYYFCAPGCRKAFEAEAATPGADLAYVHHEVRGAVEDHGSADRREALTHFFVGIGTLEH